MKKLFLALCLLLTPVTLMASDVVDPFPPQVDATLAPDVMTLSYQAVAVTFRDCCIVGRQISKLGNRADLALTQMRVAIEMNQVDGDDLATLRELCATVAPTLEATFPKFEKVGTQVEFIMLNKRHAKTTAERFEVAAGLARASAQLGPVKKKLDEIQEAVDTIYELTGGGGMTATNYSVANPNDPNMLDVAGFDASCPAVISKFAKGF